MFSKKQLQSAIHLLEQCDGLIIAAGAGMGVDSGLPDFRGTDGFWKAYPSLGAQKIAFHEIASPSAFRRHPTEAWGFYGYSIFTSNVDGQFQRAGFSAQQINECHGSIHQMQCMLPCSETIWPAQAFDPQVDTINCHLENALPICPHCGGLARPHILMFDDWSWLEHHQQRQMERQQRWLDTVRRPLVIEIGAGTAIPTVRHFSQRVLQRHGGRLIRINLRESGVANVLDVGLAAGAVEALTAMDVMLKGG